MRHSEFVEKFNDGKISVNVDKNLAGFLYGRPGLLPRDIRLKQANLRTFAIGGTLAGLVLFFFIPWEIALIVLFIGLALFPICQKNAANGVLEAALDLSYVYNVAIEEGVLKITEK